VKIQHYTFSETGGAGRVAKTLVAEQSRMGMDSSIETFVDLGLVERPLSHPLVTLAAAADRWIVTRAGVPTLTSLLRSKVSLLKPASTQAASIYHLHWMEGVTSTKNFDWFSVQDKPVVWTLHDARPFTGFCHLPDTCTGYQSFCRSCPQARFPFQSHISRVLMDAEKAISRVQKLAVVTPSSWLADQAKSSRVFSGRQVEVIPNPIDNAFFNSRISRSNARLNLGFSDGDVIGVVVAENLLDPVKRVEEIVREFSLVSDSSEKALKLLLVGRGGNTLGHKVPSVLALGPMEKDELINVLSAADYLISGSISESAGLTISEAGALGLPSLVASGSGSETQIVPEKSGLVFSTMKELGQRITQLSSNPNLLLSLGAEAKLISEEHRASVVVSQYQEIYSGLLA
jgi:glycosyltransferase involved in cell wall biosynthesis